MTKKTNKQGMTPAEVEQRIRNINPERYEYVKRFGCFGYTATGQPIEWISKQEFFESEKQTALRKKREQRAKLKKGKK
tara:strand:- start:876 stop:1109 length:234 start_codon:yes stop_codon:yes gene_type:complete